MTQHTPGAIRAAEIITQRKYDPAGKDQKRFNTEYGTKTVMGIAAIIDRHTHTPKLLEALERVATTHSHIETANMPEWLEDVETAIKAATESKP